MPIAETLLAGTSTSGGVYGSSGATTVADTTTASAPSGAKIVARIFWFGSATLSSVAGGSLTWTIHGQTSGSGNKVAIATADAPSGLASSTTITATFSTFADARGIHLSYVDANALVTNAGSGVDVSSFPAASSTANWTLSLTTTNAADFVLGVDWCDFYTGGMTPGSGVTEVFDRTTTDGSEVQGVNKTLTTSGSNTINGTYTGAHTNAAGAVAFKQFVPSPTVAVDTIATVQVKGKTGGVTAYGGSTPQVSNRIWNAIRSGRARYVVVGDSYVEGTGSSGRSNAFAVKIASSIRTAHSISGTGVGLINYDDRSASTGTVASDDTQGQASTAHLTGSSTISWAMTGTAFDVMYRETPTRAVITVKVDGSTVGTITHPGSGSNVISKRANFSGLSAGAHTVQLVTTDDQYIDGIVPYNGDSATAGVSFIKCGRSGTLTAYWVGTNPNARAGWAQFAPDAVFIEPVINDCWNNVALATTKANLADQIAYARTLPGTPSVFYIVPFYTNFATFFDDGTASKNSLGLNLDDYRAAAIDAATQAGAYVIDMRKYIPDPVGSGYLTGGHPNDAGHQAYADAISAFIDANDFPNILTADPATITVTGQTVGVSSSHPIIAITPGTINVTGQTVGTGPTRAITPAAAISLTGQTVTATGAHVIAVDPATISVNGQTVGLDGGHPIVAADPATITLTGQVITPQGAHTVTLTAAGISLSGQTVGLHGASTLAVDPALISLMGQTVGLQSSSPIIAVTAATITLAGRTVTVVANGNPVLPTTGVMLTLSVGPARSLALDAGPRRGLE